MDSSANWWKHGVIYQIYPRSFFDSNGDGIGDLAGINAKLDYLQDLGVDGIWLSPINQSPMYDFGYDISDYRAIEPMFGSTADFDHLLKEADRRGIRVIMDLVINHTSHLHPWFLESRSSRDNPKRDWYIWHSGRNGRVPNNWLASFGGRAWEWDDATGQFYLHTFLKEQPDVNWRNPDLERAMFDEFRYWLDKGVAGFRLDVVNWFLKDDQFRSNPFTIGPRPRPYDLQKHIYDRNRPEVHDLLKRFRAVLDSYTGAMSVGEVYVEKPGDPGQAADYLGNGNDELHLSFDFSLLYAKWGAHSYAEAISNWMRRIPRGGWPCHVVGNHDQPRVTSRLGNDEEAIKRAKVVAALLLTLQGTPFLYYGDEIGMINGRIKRRDLQDPVGKRYWPFHPGRDPERTPMQWDGSTNAGFSSGPPWLPVNPDFPERNVEAQLRDPASLLVWYKRLIALRKEYAALHQGSWVPGPDAGQDVYAFKRVHEQSVILVLLNFGRRSRRARVGQDHHGEVLLSTHRSPRERIPEDVTLAPYEVTIVRRG